MVRQGCFLNTLCSLALSLTIGSVGFSVGFSWTHWTKLFPESFRITTSEKLALKYFSNSSNGVASQKGQTPKPGKYAVCKSALFQQIIYESINKAQLTSSLGI